jgi:hypothetical protein
VISLSSSSSSVELVGIYFFSFVDHDLYFLLSDCSRSIFELTVELCLLLISNSSFLRFASFSLSDSKGFNASIIEFPYPIFK